MDADTLMLYKLIILYILDRLDTPINNAELTRILLERNIATFLSIQEALEDLVTDEYIQVTDNHNSHVYSITKEGSETLSFFYKTISVELRDDIDKCLMKEQYHLRDLAASTADYYEVKKDEYTCELKVVERGTEMINISLMVTSPAQAETICNRWKEANADVYQYIFQRLVVGKEPESDK